MSQSVSESLNKFQADLGLIDEDVAQIKRPILERRAAEDQQLRLEQQRQQDAEKVKQPNEEMQKLQPERRREDQQPTSPEHGTVRSSNKVLLAGACLSSILIAGGLFYFNSTHLQPQPDVQKSPSPSITLTPIASLPSSPKPTTFPSPPVSPTNTPVSSLPTPPPTAIPSHERNYITVKTKDDKIQLRSNTSLKTDDNILKTLTPYTIVSCGKDTKSEIPLSLTVGRAMSGEPANLMAPGASFTHFSYLNIEKRSGLTTPIHDRREVVG